MPAPVFIAGLGAISAIGKNTAENFDALKNYSPGMGAMKYLHSAHAGSIPVAEVKATNEELAMRSGLHAGISRTALLASVAAQEALHDAGIANTRKWRVGFVSANTTGGMDKTEEFFEKFANDRNKGKLRDVVNHECGTVTELVADQLGIKDFVTTVSTACSSSANSIFFGARLIRQNRLDIVVAGGADALTRFTVNGFNSLMILDREYCKPFDENRKGLNIAEGAAYVVLASEKVMKETGLRSYCTLSGYCNANDAYHQTASSPEGAGSYTAMKGALEKSGLKPEDISYINLHGTGTQNNDLSEGTAIQRLFHSRYPPVSSTKSFTGHTLGASGSLEAVFSALAIKNGVIYPNLRFETPMKELSMIPCTEMLENQQCDHVLSNSFGFGGNCSSLVFSKA
jgi:3-oxoacyl-(acyl-carrier-protein) synthase